MKRLVTALMIAVMCCFTQVSCKSAQREAPAEKDAKTANTVKVFDLTKVTQPKEEGAVGDFSWKENGKTVKFSELTKGKYVFLNFWGTWCPPCRAEIPDIIEISKEYANKNLIVLGVATERPNDSDPLSTVTNFAGKNNIPYRILIGNADITKAFGGISFIPKTFIIDNTGKIVETINGGNTKEGFAEILNKYIK